MAVDQVSLKTLLWLCSVDYHFHVLTWAFSVLFVCSIHTPLGRAQSWLLPFRASTMPVLSSLDLWTCSVMSFCLRQSDRAWLARSSLALLPMPISLMPFLAGSSRSVVCCATLTSSTTQLAVATSQPTITHSLTKS